MGIMVGITILSAHSNVFNIDGGEMKREVLACPGNLHHFSCSQTYTHHMIT